MKVYSKDYFNFKSLSKENDLVFFDVGSNLGDRTKSAIDANPLGTFHMFDPIDRFYSPHGKENFSFIKRLSKWKKKGVNVTFHQCAAWIYDGSISIRKGLKTNHTNTKINSLLEGAEWPKHKYSKETHKVKCLDIMRFIDQSTKNSDFLVLKMDIEGAEYEIFSNLEKYRDVVKKIDILLIETHERPGQEVSFLEIFKKMKNYNKDLKIYSEEGKNYRRIL